MKWADSSKGFTIVELLIVVVVIAILAAITIVSYNGIQAQARDSKVAADFSQLQKAVMAARDSTGKTFMDLSGTGYTASPCASKTAGTNLATLPTSDTCWTRYATTLDTISTASGIDVRGLVDPWGRPYKIDENEGESGGCNPDLITVYANPFNGGTSFAKYNIYIPISGNSGC